MAKRIWLFPIFATTVFSGQLVQAETRGAYCHSSQSKAVLKIESAKQPSQLSRNRRHALALEAADLVYKLGDLESSRTGLQLIEKHREFRLKIPHGYSPLHYISDRQTGLKYVILEPDDVNAPWIMSFAGTESARDWLGNLSLGRKQMSQAEGLSAIFTTCEYTDRTGVPWGNRDWIITGHSLGGGVAQVFSYQLQSQRRRLGLDPLQLELVTFNAFGARSVIEDSPAEVEAVLPDLNASHYFVTGDPVSMIGQHLGPTYVLRTSPLLFPKPSELARRHSLAMVKALSLKDGALSFESAPRAKPPVNSRVADRRIVKAIAQIAGPDLISDVGGRSTHALDQLKKLEDAAGVLIARNLNQPFDRAALLYISQFALRFLMQAEQVPSGGPLHEVLVRDLKQLLARTTAALALAE